MKQMVVTEAASIRDIPRSRKRTYSAVEVVSRFGSGVVRAIVTNDPAVIDPKKPLPVRIEIQGSGGKFTFAEAPGRDDLSEFIKALQEVQTAVKKI